MYYFLNYKIKKLVLINYQLLQVLYSKPINVIIYYVFGKLFN